MRIRNYNVCATCAASIANDDWTWIDGDISAFPTIDAALDAYAAVTAAVEAMGNVIWSGRTVNGYGRCFVCDTDAVDPQVWETNLPAARDRLIGLADRAQRKAQQTVMVDVRDAYQRAANGYRRAAAVVR